MKIKRQTVGAPLLETFLYISVFGAALGLADPQAPRLRLRRLRDPRPDHDGLGDERVLQQLVLDPPAEVPARDRRPALLARLADSSCCSASRSAGSCAGARRDADVLARRRSSSTSRSSTARPHPRRCCSSASSSPSSASSSACAPSSSTTCPSTRRSSCTPLIFLGGVFYSATLLPAAVRDADAVQPALLHDRPGPLRLPRLPRHEHRAVARVPPARLRGAVRGELPHVHEGLAAAGVVLVASRLPGSMLGTNSGEANVQNQSRGPHPSLAALRSQKSSRSGSAALWQKRVRRGRGGPCRAR